MIVVYRSIITQFLLPGMMAAEYFRDIAKKTGYTERKTQEVARRQIEANAGTQFDPELAAIMLQLIDEDAAYAMHE